MPDTASIISLLKRVPIFAELQESPLKELAQHCHKRLFRKGEAIVHKGDAGHTLYIICSGRVNIQNETSDGETVHIAHRGPGECVGELALIDGKPRMADIVTAEPTELLTLRRDAFVQCLKENPEIAMRVMAVLADRLREAAALMGEFQELDVLGRVANALYTRWDAAAKPEPDGGRRLTSKVTQHQLAAEVGASRESVNRALRNLKQTCIIRTEVREIIIMDEKRLRQIGSL